MRSRVRAARRGVRPGFSLVEVITAMAILAVALTLLATLAVSIGRRGRMNELTTKRNLALAQQASRLQVMPLADLAKLSAGTTQMLIGDFTFNRRLAITTSGADRYKVRIVIGPVAGEFSADSITIDRTRMASGSPLCTRC